MNPNIIPTLTDEEFCHQLDPTDPIQARAQEILLSVPTTDELDSQWANPDEIAENAVQMEAVIAAVWKLKDHIDNLSIELDPELIRLFEKVEKTCDAMQALGEGDVT